MTTALLLALFILAVLGTVFEFLPALRERRQRRAEEIARCVHDWHYTHAMDDWHFPVRICQKCRHQENLPPPRVCRDCGRIIERRPE